MYHVCRRTPLMADAIAAAQVPGAVAVVTLSVIAMAMTTRELAGMLAGRLTTAEVPAEEDEVVTMDPTRSIGISASHYLASPAAAPTLARGVLATEDVAELPAFALDAPELSTTSVIHHRAAKRSLALAVIVLDTEPDKVLADL